MMGENNTGGTAGQVGVAGHAPWMVPFAFKKKKGNISF